MEPSATETEDLYASDAFRINYYKASTQSSFADNISEWYLYSRLVWNEVRCATEAENNVSVLLAQVLPCSKRLSHDWCACPFLHPNEKSRRRCLRQYKYSAIVCADMRDVRTHVSHVALEAVALLLQRSHLQLYLWLAAVATADAAWFTRTTSDLVTRR
jgi:hypothetical protein